MTSEHLSQKKERLRCLIGRKKITPSLNRYQLIILSESFFSENVSTRPVAILGMYAILRNSSGYFGECSERISIINPYLLASYRGN